MIDSTFIYSSYQLIKNHYLHYVDSRLAWMYAPLISKPRVLFFCLRSNPAAGFASSCQPLLSACGVWIRFSAFLRVKQVEPLAILTDVLHDYKVNDKLVILRFLNHHITIFTSPGCEVFSSAGVNE